MVIFDRKWWFINRSNILCSFVFKFLKYLTIVSYLFRLFYRSDGVFIFDETIANEENTNIYRWFDNASERKCCCTSCRSDRLWIINYGIIKRIHLREHISFDWNFFLFPWGKLLYEFIDDGSLSHFIWTRFLVDANYKFCKYASF